MSSGYDVAEWVGAAVCIVPVVYFWVAYSIKNRKQSKKNRKERKEFLKNREGFLKEMDKDK